LTDPLLSFDVTFERSGFSLHAAAEFHDGVTAVFGPSGAGKSTLLGCIGGTVKPDRGWIAVGGRRVFDSGSRLDLPPQKRRVGMVYQDSALFPHMSVLQNIEYGFRLTPQNLRTVRPGDAAELLDIARLFDRSPSQLSGGEKQRVALARALAMSPDLLLLDEPMASLDLGLRGVVLGYLKSVRRELNVPMVYVSHSISEVMALADRALLLVGGRVTALDTPSRIILQAAAGLSVEDSGLDNLLEASVVEAHSDGSAGKVRVGSTELVAPTGRRQFGERVVLAIGAGEIILANRKVEGLSARNVIPGTVTELHANGGRCFVKVNAGAEFIVELTHQSAQDLAIRPGSSVYLVFKSTSIAVMDAFKSQSTGIGRKTP
jgi:molybdate transport system ATP-binding protein